MEDSGIDSEDKNSTMFEDIPVVGKKDALQINRSLKEQTSHQHELEVIFRGVSNEASAAEVPNRAEASCEDDAVVRTQPPSTCRIMQRKLELKVERARRNYNLHQEETTKRTQTANLIPISRLPIPGQIEQKPLVDYNSESSDEIEEISFFPAKLKQARKKKAELTDTFSIQEMTIDSDLDSDESGSQNLELLPPLTKSNFIDKLKKCFCGS